MVAVRRLALTVLLTVLVVGCGSDGTEGENVAIGTWVNDSGAFVAKIVISGEDFQTFRNLDDTEPSSEGTCVDEDEWIDDAGDHWWLGTCTETWVDTGEVYSLCILGRVSADGSVREANASTSGCPEGHGPDDPPTTRYVRADP